MNILQRIEHWGDSHHPKWLDIIRITLGIFLCYKGVDFLMDTGVLIGLMSKGQSFDSFIIVMLAHIVPFVHILGGVLLVLGLFTRFACLIQIPILIGAIIFIQAANSVSLTYAPFFVTLIVLLLLIYFLIVGNGPWAFKIGEEEKKKVHA